MLGNEQFQFSFTNQSSAIYEVLGTANLALPVAQWEVLGLPTSLGGGLYQFTDTLALNHLQRFYGLRAQPCFACDTAVPSRRSRAALGAGSGPRNSQRRSCIARAG